MKISYKAGKIEVFSKNVGSSIGEKIFHESKLEEAKQSMSWIITSSNHSIKHEDVLLASLLDSSEGLS